jgi:hypothetical protein
MARISIMFEYDYIYQSDVAEIDTFGGMLCVEDFRKEFSLM